MRYEIYVSYVLFGQKMEDKWYAPDDKALKCMLDSAFKYGFTVKKIDKVAA